MSELLIRRRHMQSMEVDYHRRPFTIVSLEDNNTITFKVTSETNFTPVTLFVSTVKSSMGTSKTATEAGTTLATLNRGEKLYIHVINYATQSNFPYSDGTDYHSFDTTGLVALEGNIMSLLYHVNFSEQTALNRNYTFYKMFYYSGKIDNIDNLVMPATTLVDYCYASMFSGQDYIDSIPEDLLPATTMAEYCYQEMFSYTSNLTSIPSGLLPATSLANYCYGGMFSNGGLTSLPSGLLPAATLAANCYRTMFYKCTSLVTIAADLMAATTLAEACCRGMFSGDTALQNGPDLTAATLVTDCYRVMFNSCSSISYVKCTATSISASGATSSWLASASSTGTFVKKSSVTWARTTSGIPSGWTVQNVS